MKSIRSTGLILIMAGLLSTSGPTWAAGNSAHRSPLFSGISGALSGALDAFGGFWDSVAAGFQSILKDDVAPLEKGSKEPVVQETPPAAPPPTQPPLEGGGCIDPNGCT